MTEAALFLQYVAVKSSVIPREQNSPQNAPDGASGCSHGCSGAAAQPPAAEPVVSPIDGFAPDGATESGASGRPQIETIPPPLPGRHCVREGPRVSLRFTRGYIPGPHLGPRKNPSTAELEQAQS